MPGYSTQLAVHFSKGYLTQRIQRKAVGIPIQHLLDIFLHFIYFPHCFGHLDMDICTVFEFGLQNKWITWLFSGFDRTIRVRGSPRPFKAANSSRRERKRASRMPPQRRSRTPSKARNGRWMHTSVFCEVEDNAIDLRTNSDSERLSSANSIVLGTKVRCEHGCLDVDWVGGGRKQVHATCVGPPREFAAFK